MENFQTPLSELYRSPPDVPKQRLLFRYGHVCAGRRPDPALARGPSAAGGAARRRRRRPPPPGPAGPRRGRALAVGFFPLVNLPPAATLPPLLRGHRLLLRRDSCSSSFGFCGRRLLPLRGDRGCGRGLRNCGGLDPRAVACDRGRHRIAVPPRPAAAEESVPVHPRARSSREVVARVHAGKGGPDGRNPSAAAAAAADDGGVLHVRRAADRGPATRLPRRRGRPRRRRTRVRRIAARCESDALDLRQRRRVGIEITDRAVLSPSSFS